MGECHNGRELFVPQLPVIEPPPPPRPVTTPTELSRHPRHYTCKGNAVPLQAWAGPEGSKKLRFPDFMTTAQDGGKVVSLTHRPPLRPGNTPGTHSC